MKTLAIRLEEDRHAELSVLAQLAGRTITDEIREALVTYIESKKADPQLMSRAQGVLDDIERKAQERAAVISTLFAFKETPHPSDHEGGEDKPNTRKKPPANTE